MTPTHPHHVTALAILVAVGATTPAAHAQRVTKDPATKSTSTKRPSTQGAGRAADRGAERAASGGAAAVAKSLADADVAFAQRAGSAGMKDALLATLADDAVLFHPRAVSGRGWAGATTFPAGQFTWAPGWAAVSADGTIGVTTGPIVFTSPTPDSTLTGQYVNVWTRGATAGAMSGATSGTASGPWKLFLHLVVPGPQAPQVTFAPHQPIGDGRPRGGPGAVDASRATLYIADRGLAASARADGTPAAFARVALPDARLIRPGALPYVGVDSIRTVLAGREGDSRFAWQMTDLRMARSGDLGVAYGVYERRSPAGSVTEEGNYVRVWERQPDGGWRILLDGTAPLTNR